ncbi:MAG: hypothetical protein P8P74_18625 [Crocinitomicaceae bacterium]|nr:hypothetical protein [Crocinitomicaceae bacterium]
MKIIIASLLLVLVASSCGKWDGKKDKQHNLTYYSVDFKEKNFDILGVHSSDIEALWVEFYSEKGEKEYTNYSLIVKSNGEFTKEHGTCAIDWANDLTFNPENENSYEGEFIYEKEKYTITYDLKERLETLTFVYKEKEGCGKW